MRKGVITMSVAQDRLKERICGKKISIIGIGVSNTPVIKQFASLGAHVTARDRNPAPISEAVQAQFEALGVKLVLGEGYLDNIEDDIILRTPGMRYDAPALQAARARGAEVTSEMELFFELCPCPIFAVTGSDGKTTTTTLICEMLTRQGFKCHKGGNIGTPLLPIIHQIACSDLAVVELSSFQLHDMTCSPDVAVITNLSPNHLDYHTDFTEYIEAKANIFRHQTPNDRLVYNSGNATTVGLVNDAPGNRVAFNWGKTDGCCVYCRDNIICYVDGSGEREVLKASDIRLPGKHNIENYMAAIAAAMDYVDPENITAVAREFGGVEHRIEFVREIYGVCYYNDSIASSPTRAAAGLMSFDKQLILIAGGYDKNLDYTEFGSLVCERVKHLILLGATAQKIYDAVTISPLYNESNITISRCENMDQAVQSAASIAKKGDIVMLSPASASFDQFKNFMERGKKFKDLVNAL